MDYTLVVGNKNYSSWSLRPWLVMKHLGLDFEEVVIPLYREDSKPKLLKYSEKGMVPVLKADGHTIWDSLAICEFLNDQFPDKALWPTDRWVRAHARSISNEMHSGFFEIRNDLNMNIRRRFEDFVPSEKCQAEIDHIQKMWEGTRKKFGQGGKFLYGDFTIADAMYAPVVLRFQSYCISLSNDAKAYSEAILNLPILKEWVEAGEKEEWVIEEAE